MNSFSKIIGYNLVVDELKQVIDMIKNKELYERMGAKMPKGILISGRPGLGKTMMCNAFIEESGLPAFAIRKNKNENDFIASISEAFAEAREKSPCIVFLDDLCKFANEDDRHRDAQEYVAVQAGIDSVSDKDVLVLATVNDIRKLPPSLIRSGRFDRTIKLESPTESDAEKIIAYYLSDKKVSPDVNIEDLTKMISYSTCAELETILNEAAISAAHKRKENIEMDDLMNVVLRKQYDASTDDFRNTDEDETRRLALHEAGHLVCSEIISPGSIGLASICPTKRTGTGGFVHRCKEIKRRPNMVLVYLASKAAVELYYADHVASGCTSDIYRALDLIREGMAESATYGFGMVDVSNNRFENTSESLNSRHEAVTQALMENYLLQAKDILLKNRAFLESIADDLQRKGTLLYSDIQRIRKASGVSEIGLE